MKTPLILVSSLLASILALGCMPSSSSGEGGHCDTGVGGATSSTSSATTGGDTGCHVDHGVGVMQDGVCHIASCDPWYHDCDNDMSNGCEAHLFDDVNHCGSCYSCDIFHAGATCEAGYCVPHECDPGWINCQGPAYPSCEAHYSDDPSNCGKCGNFCAGGQKCIEGDCQ